MQLDYRKRITFEEILKQFHSNKLNYQVKIPTNIDLLLFKNEDMLVSIIDARIN